MIGIFTLVGEITTISKKYSEPNNYFTNVFYRIPSITKIIITPNKSGELHKLTKILANK